MTDKPIIFGSHMVRALLDGRKSQTRRVIRRTDLMEFDGVEWKPIPVGCAIGDRLWCREAWRVHCVYEDHPPSILESNVDVQYLADNPLSPWDSRTRSPIHMPRKFSRLTLVVTDVRVERVQDISEDDARAEGVERSTSGYDYSPLSGEAFPIKTYRTGFVRTWQEINEKRGFGWETNPWVVALSFDVHRCNIDAMPKEDKS